MERARQDEVVFSQYVQQTVGQNHYINGFIGHDAVLHVLYGAVTGIHGQLGVVLLQASQEFCHRGPCGGSPDNVQCIQNLPIKICGLSLSCKADPIQPGLRTLSPNQLAA